MLSKEFVEKMKIKLLEEQARLEAEFAGLAGHVEIGSRDDENAKEAEEDEINRSIKIRIQADLEKIAKALNKIELGTYGVDDFGQAIAEDRLEALPWADRAI
ncbi:MAG: hypothetical protein AAB410_04950 [Patescibacteria group bacterium]